MVDDRSQLESFEIKITGKSMWPLLRDGQRFLVTPQAEIKIGDILCLRSKKKGEFILHRKIAIDLTKGDNNPCYDDDLIILGKVEVRYRLFNFFKISIQKLSSHYLLETNSVARKLIKLFIITLNVLTILSGRKNLDE